MSKRMPSTRRVAAALTGTGALGAAFVMAPAMTLSAPAVAPAAVPAAKPLTPTTQTQSLAHKGAVSAAQAGPTTTIPSSAFTNGPRRTIDRAGLTDDAVIEVPATGDLIGVTWPKTATAVTGAAVLVRAKSAAGWQPWHRLTVDPTSNAQGDRIGTEPVWEPGAQRVQVRVAKTDRALLDSAALSTVTAPAAATDAQLTPTAVPGAASAAYQPTVITRAQWGANESLKRCATEYDPTTKAVIVHHTADTNSYTKADSARMLRSILTYETRTLGWCDMAYNVIVDKYGQTFEGRAGGLNRPVRGAHAYAFNNGTFGASILGNYDVVPVPAAGFNALAGAIAMRVDAFYLDPFAKVSLVSSASGGTGRYPKGKAVTLNLIGGHRDTSYTICPGRYLYPRLGELRSLVASKLTYKNSPIYKKYLASGGAATQGAVSVGETTLWTGTRATTYTSGRVIYSGPRGTFLLGPTTSAVWRAAGGPAIGNLITDETWTTQGAYTKLDSGRYITRSNAGTTSVIVEGSIVEYWKRYGGAATTNPFALATAPRVTTSYGWSQAFANGHVYLSKAGVAHGTIGAIDAAYTAAGGPTGALGLPTGDRYVVGDSYRQAFAHGTIVIGGDGKATVTRS